VERGGKREGRDGKRRKKNATLGDRNEKREGENGGPYNLNDFRERGGSPTSKILGESLGFVKKNTGKFAGRGVWRRTPSSSRH